LGRISSGWKPSNAWSRMAETADRLRELVSGLRSDRKRPLAAIAAGWLPQGPLMRFKQAKVPSELFMELFILTRELGDPLLLLVTPILSRA